jgi:drug/metabolite transporter (DMT)-like permease
MIYLFFAVAASTLILVCFKLFERYKIDSFSSITINYIVGALFGFGYTGRNYTLTFSPVDDWMIMSLITGALLILGFVMFSISARKAGIALTAISSRMSVIIPVVIGLAVIGDKAGPVKIAGILLALIAFYLTLKKEKAIVLNVNVFIIPVSVFLLMGLNDSAVKITQYFFLPAGNEAAYVTYAASAFAVAFVFGILISIYRFLKQNIKFKPVDLLAGVVLGLLNWYSLFYLLKGLELVQISVFIPLLNISVVILSSLTGYFIFSEKLRAINWVGIAVSVIAIYMIASG